MSDDLVLVLVGVAVATYLTRVAGYVLVARIRTMPPRLAAGLEAVPVAVMTTLFAPQIVGGSWREAVAMAVALLVALRFGSIAMLVAGTLTVIVLRAI